MKEKPDLARQRNRLKQLSGGILTLVSADLLEAG